MIDDGYLFLKGFLNPNDVLLARDRILEHILEIQSNEKRQILEPSAPVSQGVLDHRCGRGCVPFMEGKNNITHDASVLNVIESTRFYEFFANYFGTTARTFDYKWLRVKKIPVLKAIN